MPNIVRMFDSPVYGVRDADSCCLPVGTLTYPRLKSISSLVMALARFPSLGRQISEALLSIGEAIATNSTKSEQAVLLSGLMVDEAQVRHACLQALVVSTHAEGKTSRY